MSESRTSKLPKWAQEIIRILKQGRERAIRERDKLDNELGKTQDVAQARLDFIRSLADKGNEEAKAYWNDYQQGKKE